MEEALATYYGIRVCYHAPGIMQPQPVSSRNRESSYIHACMPIVPMLILQAVSLEVTFYILYLSGKTGCSILHGMIPHTGKPTRITYTCLQGRHFILICGRVRGQCPRRGSRAPWWGSGGEAPWSPSVFGILKLFLTCIFVGNMMKFPKQLYYVLN